MPEKQWDAAQTNQWLINILIIGAWLTIVPLLKMSNTISVGYTDTLWHSDEKLVKVPKNRRMRAGKWFFSFLSSSLWLLTGRLCSTNLKTSSYYQIIPVWVCVHTTQPACALLLLLQLWFTEFIVNILHLGNVHWLLCRSERRGSTGRVWIHRDRGGEQHNFFSFLPLHPVMFRESKVNWDC